MQVISKSPKREEVAEPETDCFVSGIFAVVLRLARFVGVAPLHFVKSKTGWRVSLSMGWSIYGYFLITIIVFLTVMTLGGDLLADPEKSVRVRTKVRCVVFIVNVSIGIMVAATAVLGAPGYMRLMIDCLNHVEKIYNELDIQQWPMCPGKKKYCLLILWVLASVTLTSSEVVLQTLTVHMINGDTWISLMYSFFYICYWILKMGEMLFIMITLHVMYTFRTVNDKLRSFSYDGSTKSKCPHPETIRRLGLIYASACDVVQEVNECYGVIVMMMLGYFLLHHVYSPYYLLKNLVVDKTTQNTAIHVISSMVQLFWCLDHTVNLIMVIEPCHLTHMEMEITRELVSNLMRYTDSIYDPLAVELDLFSKHLLLNDVSYSPLKVVKMSRTLVATILGSITTYLVIIIKL